MIEPRNETELRGPTWFSERRQHRRAVIAWRGGPTGVEEHGTCAQGFPRNLGGPDRPRLMPDAAGGATQMSRPTSMRSIDGAERSDEARSGTACEGNEARAEGWREVGALHRTCEAGEPTRGTLRRERGAGVTEPLEGKMQGTPSPVSVSTRLERIAELARKAPEHGVHDAGPSHRIELLHEAYRRTRKDGAVGIDGLTADSMKRRLEANLSELLERFKSGTYRAPPVRRVYIPKEGVARTSPAHWYTYLRGQNSAEGGDDGAGAVYEQDFWTARTASDRNGRPTKRWRRCGGD